MEKLYIPPAGLAKVCSVRCGAIFCEDRCLMSGMEHKVLRLRVQNDQTKQLRCGEMKDYGAFEERGAGRALGSWPLYRGSTGKLKWGMGCKREQDKASSGGPNSLKG
jgi:hypothetical protein